MTAEEAIEAWKTLWMTQVNEKTVLLAENKRLRVATMLALCERFHTMVAWADEQADDAVFTPRILGAAAALVVSMRDEEWSYENTCARRRTWNMTWMECLTAEECEDAVSRFGSRGPASTVESMALPVRQVGVAKGDER